MEADDKVAADDGALHRWPLVKSNEKVLIVCVSEQSVEQLAQCFSPKQVKMTMVLLLMSE
jgi:hypothetical protein